MADESKDLREALKYEDGYPKETGILLSNRIHELCTHGLLISDGYDEKQLRPASYTLTVGDDYIDSDGVRRKLSEKNDTFVFKQNSIVFVSMRERLDLPFYIVARFNIRVNWVYDGVLLGTGPQVDPGFSGFLSCPLYNLTNGDLVITRGQPFATIDFEKTTNLLDGFTLEEKKKIIQGAADKDVVLVGDQKYSFYKTPPLKALQHATRNMVSSLIEMREEVRTWRRLGIGSLVAFFGLTLSLLAFGANLYRQNSDLNRQMTESKDAIRDANQKIADLQEKQKKFSSCMDQVDKKLNDPHFKANLQSCH